MTVIELKKVLTHYLELHHGNKDVRKQWLRKWLVAWQPQDTTRTNVDSRMASIPVQFHRRYMLAKLSFKIKSLNHFYASGRGWWVNSDAICHCTRYLGHCLEISWSMTGASPMWEPLDKNDSRWNLNEYGISIWQNFVFKILKRSGIQTTLGEIGQYHIPSSF